MKWNAKNIALTAGVVLVWIYLGYKVYDYYFGSDVAEQIVESDAMPSDIDIKTTRVKDYALSDLSYRDPFLGKISKTSSSRRKYVPSRNGNNNDNSRRPSIVRGTGRPIMANGKPEAAHVNWPQIVYKGLIENPETGRSAGLLRINGKDLFFLSGETFLGVTVNNIYSDSAHIKFGGIPKTIIK